MKYEASKRPACVGIIKRDERRKPHIFRDAEDKKGIMLDGGYIKATIHRDGKNVPFELLRSEYDRVELNYSTIDELESKAQKIAQELGRRRGIIAA